MIRYSGTAERGSQRSTVHKQCNTQRLNVPNIIITSSVKRTLISMMNKTTKLTTASQLKMFLVGSTACSKTITCTYSSI